MSRNQIKKFILGQKPLYLFVRNDTTKRNGGLLLEILTGKRSIFNMKGQMRKKQLEVWQSLLKPSNILWMEKREACLLLSQVSQKLLIWKQLFQVKLLTKLLFRILKKLLIHKPQILL